MILIFLYSVQGIREGSPRHLWDVPWCKAGGWLYLCLSGCCHLIATPAHDTEDASRHGQQVSAQISRGEKESYQWEMPGTVLHWSALSGLCSHIVDPHHLFLSAARGLKCHPLVECKQTHKQGLFGSHFEFTISYFSETELNTKNPFKLLCNG